MWKPTLLLSLAFLFVHTSAHSMSFPTDQTWKKLKKEAKKEQRQKHSKSKTSAGTDTIKRTESVGNASDAGLTPIELFASPFQPGGSYLMTINPMNLYRLVTGRTLTLSERQIKMLNAYVDMRVVSDPDIAELNDNPLPDRDYKAKLSRLKTEKAAYYRHLVLSGAVH